MRQECLIGSELYGLSHGLYLARRESGLRGRGGGYVGEGEHFPAFQGCKSFKARNAGEAQPPREADRPHIHGFLASAKHTTGAGPIRMHRHPAA